ncbi:MAG: chlororespiratory reduction protein 7 [Cyanobacteria bacterium P01_D01_bin.128]
MADALMYQEDMFVLLTPGEAEAFFTPDELRAKLVEVLAKLTIDLPKDVQKFDTAEAQAEYLVENACELTIAPGQTLQWYAVRLEK